MNASTTAIGDVDRCSINYPARVQLRIPIGERLLELRDPLLPPILRHGIVASPKGAGMESGNFLWSDLEHLREA